MPDSSVRGHAVRAGQDTAHHHGDAQSMGADIGALIVPELVIERHNDAIRIDAGAQPVALLTRMISGDEMLAAVLDPFDRAHQPHRGDAHQHILGIKLAAHTEAAAHMGLMNMNR
jgi:hypothetical protein